jgi:hypothetical protein
MDVGFLSALAALAGSAVGGLTSLAASWLSQRGQLRTQQWAHEVARREDLYREFIDQASAVYIDALQHQNVDISKLVTLYALVSRMRVLSRPAIVDHADTVIHTIIATYFQPNVPFERIWEDIKTTKFVDPMRDFSDACREELRRLVPT